jgi:hypothetical protein
MITIASGPNPGIYECRRVIVVRSAVVLAVRFSVRVGVGLAGQDAE